MSDLVRCAATLVVCPTSLMMQWEKEALSKFSKRTLKVLVYHGAKRTKVPEE